MCSLEDIPDVGSVISCWVQQEGKTFQEISNLLKQMYPRKRGLSVRTVKRFCSLHGIHKRLGLSDDQVDRVVKNAINKVSFVIRGSAVNVLIKESVIFLETMYEKI